MDRFFTFIKEHPMIAGATALFVLLIIFWPRGSSDDGGSSDAAIMAAAIGASQQAATDLALSHDHLQAVGMQTSAAIAINESNNAAAVRTAEFAAQTEQAAIAAESDAAKHIAGLEATTSVANTIASILPTTQRQAAEAGQATDAAGFSLMEILRNLINFQQGKDAVVSSVVQDVFPATSVAPVSVPSFSAPGGMPIPGGTGGQYSVDSYIPILTNKHRVGSVGASSTPTPTTSAASTPKSRGAEFLSFNSAGGLIARVRSAFE